MTIYYHGTDNPATVIAAIEKGTIRLPFHLTPSKAVANNYGSTILEIEFDADFQKVEPRMINKENNYNKSVGNGVELVIENDVQLREFYYNALDAIIA